MFSSLYLHEVFWQWNEIKIYLLIVKPRLTKSIVTLQKRVEMGFITESFFRQFKTNLVYIICCSWKIGPKNDFNFRKKFLDIQKLIIKIQYWHQFEIISWKIYWICNVDLNLWISLHRKDSSSRSSDIFVKCTHTGRTIP